MFVIVNANSWAHVETFWQEVIKRGGQSSLLCWSAEEAYGNSFDVCFYEVDAYLNALRDLLCGERWPSTDKEIHHLTCETSLLLISFPQ